VIDCESVVEQHGDSAVIRQLAQQVGYAPIFNWLNFFSSLLDLAAQGWILCDLVDGRDNWTESWVHGNSGYASQENSEYERRSFEENCTQ
jgi:hypothetical protein